MRPRTFEFRTQGIRGFPAALLLGAGAIGVIALLVVLLFVGTAVAAAAEAVSAGVALWHGLRRKLNLSGEDEQSLPRHEPRPFFEEVPLAVSRPTTKLTEAREIEVEVLPAQGH